MHKVFLSFVGAAALTAASAASATVTLGNTGMTAGSSTSVTSSVTQNVTIPNAIEFDTNNAAQGTDTSYVDFKVDYASIGVFSVTTATYPASTVTLVDLLTGTAVTLDPNVYGASAGSNSGSSYSLNVSANLAANTWYRFVYTANMATAGNISGTANFYPLPEPGTWALMLLGFAGVGFAMRRGRRHSLAQLA